MPEPIHYKGVLYPVGEEPEELRDGRMVMGLRYEPGIGIWSMADTRYLQGFGWVPFYTYVGPMPEIEVSKK